MGWVTKTIFIFIVILIVVPMLTSNSKQTNIDVSKCKSNYRACKDNKDLINNHDSLVIDEAKDNCRLSVDEHEAGIALNNIKDADLSGMVVNQWLAA